MCQRAHVRLKQLDLALFTLCDRSFVFCDMAAEISATSDYICRIGPVVGIGLPVGSTLVVSPTYEPQHYKTNKMIYVPSEYLDQPGHPPSPIRVFAVRTMGS